MSYNKAASCFFTFYASIYPFYNVRTQYKSLTRTCHYVLELSDPRFMNKINFFYFTHFMHSIVMTGNGLRVLVTGCQGLVGLVMRAVSSHDSSALSVLCMPPLFPIISFKFRSTLVSLPAFSYYFLMQSLPSI